ncbi:MAG TPA: fructosamine kinase family protein [Flavitalea sp.]|nr:fructosamine kinase family protein [Flavitalea sp.]
MISPNPTYLIELFQRSLRVPISSITSVGGGSINQAFKLTAVTGELFFCKVNSSTRFPFMFQKEVNGLESLAATKTIRVPKTLFCDITNQQQVLVMEWIAPGKPADSFWKTFGMQLAALHHVNKNKFGFNEDNYMGSIEQKNVWHEKWIDFFREQRLIPQVKMAIDKAMLSKSHAGRFEKLYQKLEEIFSPESPCVVHGDLWSGNFLCSESGEPILIDPAVHYGNRHSDLAMTTLFGGFEKEFYTSYSYYYPLPPDAARQWRICNLYPLLIHLNLFGKSYLPDIIGTIDAY